MDDLLQLTCLEVEQGERLRSLTFSSRAYTTLPTTGQVNGQASVSSVPSHGGCRRLQVVNSAWDAE